MPNRPIQYGVLAGFFSVSLVFSNPGFSASEEETVKNHRIPMEDVQRFSNAINQIKKYYVKPVDDKELFDNAIRGMLAGLDPHSSYLDEESFNELQAATSGEFGGLGLEVTMEDGIVKVITPLVDTPAFKAGMKSGDYIIKPEGFLIPHEASMIHGISTERANVDGRLLSDVLQEFQTVIGKAEVLVAHNMRFDEKIVGSEFIRAGMHNPLPSKRKICTMERATDFCALKGQYGNKWPKLTELYVKLFGIGFEEVHNAAFDIQATAKCFWELKRKGIIG